MSDERDFFCLFVHGQPPPRVVAWLDGIAGPLTLAAEVDGRRVYDSDRGQVLLSRIPDEDSVSIWFNRDGRWPERWGSLHEWARQAADGLGAEVSFFEQSRPDPVRVSPAAKDFPR